MFNRNFLNNDIGYFTDTISEPSLLIKFIEELNSNESKTIFSEWENVDQDSFVKCFFAENVEINDPRTLYIFNSLYSGMRFCLDLYGEMKNITGPFNIYKKINLNKNINLTNVNKDFYENNKNVEFIILSFLNDDYEGGELVFPDNNISIKPEKGSTIVFPNYNKLNFKFNEITNGCRYMNSNCTLN